MKRAILILSLLIASLCTFAQRDPKPAEVKLLVVDSMVAIEPVTTQTQLKKGWNIVGYNVGDKTLRYLWGKRSKQFCDNSRPVFSIRPDGATLNDFAIVRLKVKRDYRMFPKPIITDNDLIHIELDRFSIKMDGEDAFIIQPLNNLPTGEYFLLNINQKAVNEQGDLKGYAFTIL